MIVLIGESGCGKSTVEKELVAKGYKKAISLTTRVPRKGEIDGVDYHFVTMEEALELKRRGEIAEWVEYLGNVYALTTDECYNSDVVVVEVEGLKQLIESGVDITVVYLNCSEEERIRRMTSRGDSEQSVMARVIKDREHFKDVRELVDVVVNVTNLDIDRVVNLVRGQI